MKTEQITDRHLVITEDGSHSLFIPEWNEHYHSIHGAINESMHIFINAGFKEVTQQLNEINILEVGFGTGLNALLTFIENKKLFKKIEYTAIEACPLEENIFKNLNYYKFIHDKNASLVLHLMHQVKWGKSFLFSEDFLFTKIKSKLENLNLEQEKYDLVYFDAFAPQVQPELCTKEIFEKIYSSMRKSALLLTYSAKGEVKRNLKSAGFTVEGIPGPKGKREITRARK